jgi:hypothetical protein
MEHSGMHNSIGGFPAEVEEKEIREALAAYGVPITDVTLAPDSGGHTLALVDVDTDELGAKALAEKLNGHIWRGRRLRARAHLFFE